MLTPYQDRKMKICRSDGSDRKRTEKKVKKNVFKTNVRSQQMKEGAVAASHLPSASCLFLSSGRTGSVLPRTPTKQWERVIKY